MSEEFEVLLPTTTEGLDQFVETITHRYGLPIHDNTYDAIATMIMHLPHTKAKATYEYFGHGVLKALANKVAYEKLEEFAEKRAKLKELEKQKQEEEKTALALVPQESSPADDQPLQNA